MFITILLILYYAIFGANSIFASNKSDKLYLDEHVILKKSNFTNLKGWKNEDYREALDVFLKSCDKILQLPSKKPIFPQLNKKINKNDFHTICKIGEIIKNYNNDYIQVFFENYFVPFKVEDLEQNNSLFTGYYIPKIKAKLNKDNIFRYPIYKRPVDLVDNEKYYTREQITSGILNNKGLEIMYTDDPVELFFLHIQGSGIVYLVDENIEIGIGFNGKNNHKFSSISKYMYNNNIIDSIVDPKRLKKLLKLDFNSTKYILNINESYIFFRIIKDKKFTGTFMTQLVPFRTIAVDRRYIPLGFPLWLSTTHNTKKQNYKFNKLVIANDTGSAINGAVRGDIFFGYGSDGEENANYQKSTGEYFLLIPKKVLKKI